jgi:predicted nucleic acid-binding protein
MVNTVYTKEVVEELIAAYKNGTTVSELADKYGVSERSIISKLSHLGYYKRQPYVNKRGEVPIKKEEYIERIAKMLDINSDLLESMEKVTKYALTLMDKQIAAMKAEIEELKK